MLSRRRLLLSAVASSAATTLTRSLIAPSASAAEGSASPTILRLERRNIEVNGKAASVFDISQPDGASGITTRSGAQFRVRVENKINEPSLIHWHGLTPPWQQDGVPGISGPPIPAGQSADYDFPLRFGGTFWMHSHQGLQEQLLMAAPLIIHDQRVRRDQQEVVVMLTDFSFTPPDEIFANLKKGGSMPAMAEFRSGASGMKTATAKPDLNDVKYDAFLANRRTLGDPEVLNVSSIGPVLLRVINSSSMSAFHVDLGELEGELIAVDGFEIAPVTGKRFPIAVAQRLDIRLAIPSGAAAYPVLAILEGENKQTGIVLRAGNAPIARIPDTAAMASPALTLDLERRLQAAAPLAPRKADRTHTLNLTGNMASMSGRSTTSPGPKRRRRCRSRRASASSWFLSIRRRCHIRCTCTAMNSKSWRSKTSDFPAPCATPCWCRPGTRWWWPSTPTIRGSGRCIAICCIISTPGCSRPCAMSSATS